MKQVLILVQMLPLIYFIAKYNHSVLLLTLTLFKLHVQLNISTVFCNFHSFFPLLPNIHSKGRMPNIWAIQFKDLLKENHYTKLKTTLLCVKLQIKCLEDLNFAVKIFNL